MNKKISKKDIIKFICFVIFFVTIVITGIVFSSKIKTIFTFEKIRNFIEQHKNISVLLFILLQVLQVVIFIIPGDIVNATGGFLFNIYIGSILSFIGVVLGSIIAFYVSRLLGYNFVNKFIKKEKIEKIVYFFNNNTGFVSLFIFCNLPFVPKDILMYCAGLTPLKAKRTFLIYCFSRIPGIIIWNSMGANLYSKSVIGIVITLLVLLIFLSSILLIKRKIDSNKIVIVK